LVESNVQKIEAILDLAGSIIDSADNNDPQLDSYWLIYSTAKALLDD
jgi:hypothetical protein